MINVAVRLAPEPAAPPVKPEPVGLLHAYVLPDVLEPVGEYDIATPLQAFVL